MGGYWKVSFPNPFRVRRPRSRVSGRKFARKLHLWLVSISSSRGCRKKGKEGEKEKKEGREREKGDEIERQSTYLRGTDLRFLDESTSEKETPVP